MGRRAPILWISLTACSSPERWGGTGLEPVTPSLSTADESLPRLLDPRAPPPPLAHTLDETLQDREPVVPDLRVAEVDAHDVQQLFGRCRASGREEALVAP